MASQVALVDLAARQGMTLRTSDHQAMTVQAVKLFLCYGIGAVQYSAHDLAQVGIEIQQGEDTAQVVFVGTVIGVSSLLELGNTLVTIDHLVQTPADKIGIPADERAESCDLVGILQGRVIALIEFRYLRRGKIAQG